MPWYVKVRRSTSLTSSAAYWHHGIPIFLTDGHGTSVTRFFIRRGAARGMSTSLAKESQCDRVLTTLCSRCALSAPT